MIVQLTVHWPRNGSRCRLLWLVLQRIVLAIYLPQTWRARRSSRSLMALGFACTRRPLWLSEGAAPLGLLVNHAAVEI